MKGKIKLWLSPAIIALTLGCGTYPLQAKNNKTQPKLEVWANTATRPRFLLREPEEVLVDIQNLKINSFKGITLRIFAGQKGSMKEITYLVPIRREIDLDFVDKDQGIEDRTYHYFIDFRSSTFHGNEIIRYLVDLKTTTGDFNASGETQVILSPAPPPGVKECVCNFVETLNPQKDADGRVFFPTSLKKEAIKNAVANLKQCLASLDPPVLSLNREQFTCQIGNTYFDVRITLKNLNGSNPAAINAPGDLTIAIGGDADPTTTKAGGNAEATTSKKGGAALAVGGKGGSNSNTPGKGGKATAKTTSSVPPGGGDAIAVGGDGGDGKNSGGDGGNADAKTPENESWARAYAGNGGDPVENNAMGGKGGNATARRGTDLKSKGFGTGQNHGYPLYPKFHGGGGVAEYGPPGPGHTHNGDPIPNQ